ncbi:hypothetical protein B0H14DRAFT_2585508 [Mycena olivaceomarginata]|nr:hypothetical protein B0H14DRAFT_2585508 [Mycena olivaceomarginata]
MNDTVNEVDWVAQGKFWASVPPRVKRMAAESFTIPQELEFELLPSPHLSMAKMLDFPLPLQNNIITATQPAQFFSINRPDVTVTTNFKVTGMVDSLRGDAECLIRRWRRRRRRPPSQKSVGGTSARRSPLIAT